MPPTETRGAIVGLYVRAAARSDEVIERLPLDAVGHVPWWPPEISRVTLHGILAHTVAEAQRHAGHADILRELVDGSTGHGPAGSLLPSDDAEMRPEVARIVRSLSVTKKIESGEKK